MTTLFAPRNSQTLHVPWTEKILATCSTVPHHPPLKMNDEPIKEVTSHRHIGIFFSNDGTWHQHIDYITSKAWTRLNIMRKLKFILDRQSLEIIYTSFIRPVLEYADVVWDNCTQYEINALEKNTNRSCTNSHWSY